MSAFSSVRLRSSRAHFAHYGVAVATTLLAALARHFWWPALGGHSPHLLFLPAVLLAAWFGGLGPGLLATVLSTAFLSWKTPVAALTADSGQQIELLLFAPTGLFIAFCCGSLHAARRLAEEGAARYRGLVETAAEGIWMVDAAFKTTFVNCRMADLLGYSAQEMLGRPFGDFLFPADDSILDQGIAGFQAGTSQKREARYRHQNGSEVWCAVSSNAVLDGKGRFCGALAMHTDITTHRRDAAALRVSNERFELAAQAMEGYIYEWDARTNRVWRSAGFGRVVGYETDEVPSNAQWWRDQIHPDDVGGALGIYRSALAGRVKNSYELEYRARHRDGSWRWVWDRGVIMRDEAGALVRVVASVVDVTGRRVLEEALREGEERFRQLADSMPQMVWAARPDGVLDYYNRRWYEFSGFAEGESGDESWMPILHPDDLQPCLAAWKSAIQTGEPFQGEYRFKDRVNGGFRWILGRALPVRGENGQIVRWFGTCTDIDEQKRAEEKQRFLAGAGMVLASSLDYAATLDRIAHLAVPELADWCFVALQNEENAATLHTIVHANPSQVAAARQRYQRGGSQLDAKSSLLSVIESGEAEFLPWTGGQTQGEAINNPEFFALRHLGSQSSITVPLKAGGRTFGAISLAYAESNRRYTLADLALAEELARRASLAIENARLYRDLQLADRRKDEFLVMLAHELRSPLAAIAAGSRVLDELSDPDLRELTAAPRDILTRQTRHLSRLVEDLLDVSRIASGKIELRRETMDLGAALQANIETLRPLIESRAHTLSLHLPAEPLLSEADPARFQQIVANLLVNAAKYTDPGGKIEVFLAREDDEAVLKVRDNGTGLKAEMLPAIFGLFVQSDRTLDRSQGGLGIGLTLVRHLAEMHGGQIDAQSDGPGKGSEFTLRLPLAPIGDGKFELPFDPTGSIPTGSAGVAPVLL